MQSPTMALRPPVIRAAWMRGGTSKCWVFEIDALPSDRDHLGQTLLSLFGSPDPRQLDGVGGGTSTTSKAVLLRRSGDDMADVDYTFAQVGIAEPVVEWASNCGNCSSVVAPWAQASGWAEPGAPVRVRNTNTEQLIVQTVTPVGPDEWSVDLAFVDPSGRSTGALLPSGSARDVVDSRWGSIDVSIVDAGAPLVLVPARAVGLRGDEPPVALEDPALLAGLDEIRRAAAVRAGMAATPEAALASVPKLAVVAPHPDADLGVRMLSMGRPHPAVAITGAIGLATATATADTVAAEISRRRIGDTVLLAGPVGLLNVRLGEHDGLPTVAVTRTARLIADARLPLRVRH